MLSSARTFSKQVLSHRTQIQQQTKTQLRNQHNGPRPPKDQQQQLQESNGARFDEDLQRQGVLDKMRQENRERKKRWRELNDERNKDNDLRCRVNKRANQLYGAHSSADKEQWVGEEFERRQQRRRDKETRKRPLSASEEESPTLLLTHSGDDVALGEGSTHRGIPTGFGCYSALPRHQVRAANDFWKSVAGHHALEAAAASSSGVLIATTPLPAAAAAGERHQPRGGVWLPPLSSVVPTELRSPPPNALGSAHVPPALSSASNAASLAHMTRARHLRPWEDEVEGDRIMADMDADAAVSCCSSGGFAHSHTSGYVPPPMLSRSTTAASPLSSCSQLWATDSLHPPHQTLPKPGIHRSTHDVAAGLSEAAFSLMSLSAAATRDSSSPMMY
ncbi:hypothetical protein H4R26_001295 [Coemansia thaxteri]|uniref:DUF3020 domain-containing protein n=1 Tax=Coemansia thaxteri TaxID=2663907 RepID=A0A9W8BF34_9FUNG|nr:hypothetical protein H4R26_001295 [Coemansia thaxteri]KAJ2485606.1 hypothetical protein EV174_001612 [Coemansia sp. RSA 2320]